jgi:hypothetical protein
MNARTSWYILAPCAIGVVLAAALLHCIAPFSAVAVVAGIAVARRYAVAITLGAWLVNQLYGFGFSHYAHRLDTLAAGLSLALGAIVAVFIAAAIARGRFGLSSLPAFIAGFAAYEAITYAFTPWVGGAESYTLPIVTEIFAVNTVFFIPLLAVAFVTARASAHAQSDLVHE